MSSAGTLEELNASYEAAYVAHASGLEPIAALDVDLAVPFFGAEWGFSEWNIQRQTWRWMGPRGRSHLFVKLTADTDHLVRVYLHTAASVAALDALGATANGTRCQHQGRDWGADGVASHWFVLEREIVAARDGVVKITWEIGPDALAAPDAAGKPGRLIAFSRVVSEPYELARPG